MTAVRFSTRPLYLQLRDVFVERIAAGVWQSGRVVPNEAELSREFGVSPGTIRKALEILESERVLTRRQGRGTFVNDQGCDRLAGRFHNVVDSNRKPAVTRTKLASVTEDVVSELERSRLRLPSSQSRVFRIQRVYFCGQRPLMVEAASVPAELFPDLQKRPDAAERLASLARQYGILLGKAEERISIGEAQPSWASTLQVPAGSPLLVLDRLVVDVGERPVEWRVAHCHLVKEFYLAKIM
jgi:GntR family transcriptional regulator